MVWFVRATTREGKKTRPKLGEWPGIGVAEARKLARQHLAAIQQGADPVGERRAARAAREAARGARTVHAAMRAWIAFHTAHPTKPWSATYTRNVESALRVHLPRRLSDRPLRETTREEWTAFIAGVRDAAPGAAAFLYTVCGSFLGHAEAKGWIGHHLFPRKGRDHVAPHPAPRERVLADWEWLAIWKATEQEPPKLRAFVRLLILTLTRKSEPAEIAIGEIGTGHDLWTIPGSRTKNKLDHTVPLCDLARAELAAVWPDYSGGAGDCWKLLGRAPGSGFSGYGRLLARLKARSGVVDWSRHDIRRAGRTTLTHLRVPEADAEAALNHVSGRSKLDRTYNHADAAPAAGPEPKIWSGRNAIFSGTLPPEGECHEAETLHGRADRLCLAAGRDWHVG